MEPNNIHNLIKSLKELNHVLESLIYKMHLEAAKVGYNFGTNKEKPVRETFLERLRAKKKDIKYLELIRSVSRNQN